MIEGQTNVEVYPKSFCGNTVLKPGLSWIITDVRMFWGWGWGWGWGSAVNQRVSCTAVTSALSRDQNASKEKRTLATSLEW